jgi:hypothetical protein
MAFQLFPSFSFFEGNVGPRPVRSVTQARVGMVGVFKYGPAVPTLADADDAAKLFGRDTSVGSAHMQAIIDQGVQDILISRVTPQAASASLSTVIAGTAQSTGTLSVSLQNAGLTPDNFSIPIASGDTASEIVTAMVAAVPASFQTILTFAVNPDNAGETGSFKVTAVAQGENGNNIPIKLDIGSLIGITGATISAAGVNLTGGKSEARSAAITLLDSNGNSILKLTELSAGASANFNTKVTVKDSLEQGRFTLILENKDRGLVETYSEIEISDVFDEDKFAPLRSSRIASGEVISTGAVPKPVDRLNFEGGSDGSPVTTEDFIRAIDALENLNCTVICCPGIKPNGVDQWSLNAALLAQAEKADTHMGEMIGLRVACLSMPRGTVASDLPGMKAASRIPDSQRVSVVVGWGTSARQPKFKRYGIDGAALMAGHLVVTRAHISPAARTSSPTIKGITELDTPASISAWNEITRYRMDALIADPVSGAFHCLNGRSTSSDPAWYWISTRRIYDKVRTDIFFNFQFIKSEPSNPALDSVISVGINAYLQNLVVNGELAGYDPTVSNDTNNPPAVRAAGERYVDIFIEPVYPNDKTQFNLNRVQRASIRLA